MLTLRLAILFVHVTAVIVALGASLFSTFALAPILADELDPPARIKVMRRVIRRLGAIVLTALAVLVLTGMVNVVYAGGIGYILALKLAIVLVVLVLAIHQFANLGARIWRISAVGPSAELVGLLARFRRVGLTVGSLVLVIIYLSLALSRVGPAIAVSMP